METVVECHYMSPLRFVYRSKQILLLKIGRKPQRNNNNKKPYRKENCKRRATIKYTSPTWGIPQAHGRRSDRPPQARSHRPRVGSSRLRCRTLPAVASQSGRGSGSGCGQGAAPTASREALPACPPCPRSYRVAAPCGARPGRARSPAPLSPAPAEPGPPRQSSGGRCRAPAKFPGGARRGTVPLPVLARSRLTSPPASPRWCRSLPERSGAATRRHQRRRGERCTPAGWAGLGWPRGPGPAAGPARAGGAERGAPPRPRRSLSSAPLLRLPPAPARAAVPTWGRQGLRAPAGRGVPPSFRPSRTAPGLRGGSPRPSLRRLRRAGGGSQR